MNPLRQIARIAEQIQQIATDLCTIRESAAGAHQEAHHACTQSVAVLEAVQQLTADLAPALALAEQVAALTDQVGRLETAVRHGEGKLDRMELHFVGKDPSYPRTQLDLGMSELARRRERIEANTQGGNQHG